MIPTPTATASPTPTPKPLPEGLSALLAGLDQPWQVVETDTDVWEIMIGDQVIGRYLEERLDLAHREGVRPLGETEILAIVSIGDDQGIAVVHQATGTVMAVWDNEQQHFGPAGLPEALADLVTDSEADWMVVQSEVGTWQLVVGKAPVATWNGEVWRELTLMEKAPEIADLSREVRRYVDGAGVERDYVAYVNPEGVEVGGYYHWGGEGEITEGVGFYGWYLVEKMNYPDKRVIPVDPASMPEKGGFYISFFWDALVLEGLPPEAVITNFVVESQSIVGGIATPHGDPTINIKVNENSYVRIYPGDNYHLLNDIETGKFAHGVSKFGDPIVDQTSPSLTLKKVSNDVGVGISPTEDHPEYGFRKSELQKYDKYGNTIFLFLRANP